MYLKRHKVGEDNPKESGWYPVKYHEGDDIIIFGEKQFLGDWILNDEDVLLFWYSEVTERLYTEENVRKSFRSWYEVFTAGVVYGPIIDTFISQLNKDKDK